MRSAQAEGGDPQGRRVAAAAEIAAAIAHSEDLDAALSRALDAAIADTGPPKGASAGMVEQLQWNVERLTAGSEISERKR